MKITKNILFLLLIVNSTVHAQIEDLERARIFNKCEITYVDGKIITGYIAFFLEPISRDWDDAIDFSIEKLLNLDDNDFEFKTSISSNSINMTQKGLKKIKVFYENDIEKIFILMDIKKFDANGNIINSTRKAWLPIAREDVINIYQKNVYLEIMKYSNKEKDFVRKKIKKSTTITYLSNEKQNIAFEIYNTSKFRLTRPKLNDKYLGKVLQYIFQDCPDFSNKILKNESWDFKPFIETKIDYDFLKNEVNNSDLNEFEKFNKIDAIDLRKERQPFEKLIDDYKSNCN